MPYQPVSSRRPSAAPRARRRRPRCCPTVPPRPDPTAAPLDGLRWSARPRRVQVTSAGVDLGTVALPPGDCTLSLGSDAGRHGRRRRRRPGAHHLGDVRPDVAGAFTEPRPPASSLAAHRRHPVPDHHHPAEGRHRRGLRARAARRCSSRCSGRARPGAARRVRLLPRRWWRPRPVDAAVDGAARRVVGRRRRSRWTTATSRASSAAAASNGFVGNVYRWLNAPEAPFSWFYDLYYAWSLVSAVDAVDAAAVHAARAAVLVAALPAACCPGWAGPRARGAPWLAALAFATWWVPLNLGCGPSRGSPSGGSLVFLAVERAVATRTLLPLAVGLRARRRHHRVDPGRPDRVHPVPRRRACRCCAVLRARRDLHRLPLLAALSPRPAAAVLLMVPDQSLAACWRPPGCAR